MLARNRRNPNATGRNQRPLRRKPKELSDEPTLFEPSSHGQGGMVLTSTARRGPRRNVAAPTGSTRDETGEVGETIALADLDATTSLDAQTRQRATQIARRLAVARPVRGRHSRRGIGDLTSARWRGGSDDIDLDATLDRIGGKTHPDQDDIIVREWSRAPRSVVLAVDVSGSMKGERIRTAAATVGALAGELNNDQIAVVAFWSDAAVLLHFGEQLEPLALLDLLLRVPTQGLTNVGFALDVARRQLADRNVATSRVLLLSDCVHNAGADPRTVASGLPRLDVLLDTSGEHDAELGRELAGVGRGQFRSIGDYRQVAGALGAIFDH